MKNIILGALVLVLVSACAEDGDDLTDNLTTVCLDGVAYWYDYGSYGSAYTPRVNPETLDFMLCSSLGVKK